MKILLLLVSTFFMIANSIAQSPAKEPEFIGEALLLKSDNSTLKLDKSIPKATFKHGLGSAKVFIEIPGCCASARISNTKPIKIIVKAVDNKTDPMSIITIVNLQKKKKLRRGEIFSAGMIGASTNNLKYIQFSAEKYGESSYLLTINEIVPGEYGITIRNPNAVTETVGIISNFGLD